MKQLHEACQTAVDELGSSRRALFERLALHSSDHPLVPNVVEDTLLGHLLARSLLRRGPVATLGVCQRVLESADAVQNAVTVAVAAAPGDFATYAETKRRGEGN